MRKCLECNREFQSDDEGEGFCSHGCEIRYRAEWYKATSKGFPGLLAVHHLDGDPTNNDLANIRLVNPRENRRNQ